MSPRSSSLLPVVWVMALGQAVSQDAVLLSGFEDPETLRAAAASRACFELVADDPKAGEKALRLSFEAVPEGRRDYPAFVLQGSALHLTDFSRFETLGFWVKNLGSSAADLSVAIRDRGGKRSFPRPSTFTVEPGGWKQVFCRLVLHGLDARDIDSVHFFQKVNREPRSFLLDQVELYSPLAAGIITRKREVLETLERARAAARQIGAEAIVGADVERLSNRLRALEGDGETKAGATGAREQLVILSRMAQEARNLAGSITVFDNGRGLALRGAKVTDALLRDARKLSGFKRVILEGTAVTDAGLTHLAGLELESLSLATRAITGSGLAALSGAKLSELDLGGSGVNDAALVHLERFPGLEHLTLAYTRVTGAGLVSCAGLSKLQGLSLAGTATTDEGLIHLRGLTSLKGLSLRETGVSGKGLAHLGGLKNLVALDLGSTPVTDRAFEGLGGLSSLESLVLSGTRILGTGLTRLGGLEKLAALDLTGTRVNDSALLGLGKLGSLKRLELSSTRITDAALVHVAASTALEYLDLYGTNVTDAGLRSLSSQRGLKELYLGGTAATDAALAALEPLRELERLDLQGTRIGDAGLEALAGLKKLTALDLSDTTVTGSGIAHLRSLGALQSLNLGRTEAGDEALQHVARLRNLRELDLRGTRVSDAGIEHLLGLEKLRVLHLEGTRASDAGIARLGKLPGLRQLHLAETGLGDAGLRDLQEAKSLVALDLSRTGISDAGLARLSDRLSSLTMRDTAISDAGILHLKGKDRLEHLDVSGTEITDHAVKALVDLPNLRGLTLSGTGITDAGIELLRSLEGLEDLRLENTSITDRGVEHLATVPRLVHVSLEGTRVTSQGKRLLAERRPEVLVDMKQSWVEGASLSRYAVSPGAAGSTLSRLRELGSTRSLRLVPPTLDAGALLHLKDLPNLEHLDLRDAAMGDDGLAHLIGLQRLSSLDLSRTRITDAGLSRLKDLQALTSLGLAGTAVRGAGLRHLEGLARLESLDLSDTPISDEAAALVAALPSLRKLTLTNTRLTDRGVSLLRRLRHLRYLDLYGTRITDEGLDSIGRMAEIRYLYLSATGATDAGLERLSALSGIVELGLDGTAVSDAGCARLGAFSRMERLRLGNTSITDRGLEHIAKLSALETLELDGTGITDAGVERLLRLTNLKRLVLDRTGVSDAALARLGGLEALESLSVRDTAVTARGAEGYTKRRPRAALDAGRDVAGPSLPGLVATALYCLIALSISVYGCHRYWLTWLFARDREARTAPLSRGKFTELPRVTVQLPMFNERRVLERVIEAACAIEYPRERLQIQVLDDSTDESAGLARACCERLRASGLDIECLHRDTRAGFKGGALEAGLQSATGELIAIFDADFVPPADFLTRTIHHFTDPRVGMVQTEWAHLNRHESLLTECQAMFLDAHFIVEQTTRHRTGRWFNFNGTAGIWRRRCIEEAGGWHHDTLTEDTDLSYRAQLAGWRFVYLPTVRSSAELPSRMSAFLGQQNRWTKGLVQNAIKLLPRILWSETHPRVKAEAWFHLTSPLLYLAMFFLTALALPAMFIPTPLAELRSPAALMIGLSVLVLGTLAAAAFLTAAQRARGQSLWSAVKRLPAVMALGVGMSATNARAAVEALIGVRGHFLRTPKFNGRAELDPDPAAARRRGFPAGLVELVAAGVMLSALVLSLTRPFTLIGSPFLLLFACGYFWVGAASLGDSLAGSRRAPAAARRVPRVAPVAVTAFVTLAVLACAGPGGSPRSSGDGPFTLGVDLALADWKHRGAAVQGVGSTKSGLELDLALDQERDEGEVFLELEGPLAPLGEALARGREVRFDVIHPKGFSGELQAFVSGPDGQGQYGSQVFIERHDTARETTVALSPGRLTPPMGHTAPGFDAAAGIRRIGLKVSAQSDRVRRQGYRPFHGHVTIASVRIVGRDPAAEPEVRPLPPGGVFPAQPIPVEEFRAQSGVDRPWPFGYGFSGPVTEAHREELARGYRAIARRGLGLTRVYIGDYRTGLIFDEEGAVSGIEAQFLDYLDMLAGEAARSGITVMLSLMDNTVADGKGIEHRELIADPERSDRFLVNAIVPIAGRLERHRVILDLFNEPENVTMIPVRVVEEYVDRAVRRIRAAVPGARLGVVSRSREELIYWRGRGLDTLAHNIFDERTLLSAIAGSGPLELDAPLWIAEMDPALATPKVLDALRGAGYRGVGLWGWGTEDKYAWRAEDLDRITAPFDAMDTSGDGR